MALAVKMASLTIKSAAKPLANVFQQWVLSRPEARRVAIAGAQRLHRWDVNITRGAEGKEGKIFVGKMNDEQALKLASKFVSEAFLYTVAGGLIVFELQQSSNREKRKKEDKERRRRQKDEERHRHMEEQAMVLQAIRAKHEELGARIEALEKGSRGGFWRRNS